MTTSTQSSIKTLAVGLTVQFKKLNPNAVLPRYAYEQAVGFDLAACLMSESGKSQQVVLPPNSVRIIPTGLAMIPPKGYFIGVCSRSGLASKNPPIFVSNAPGIIDPDYTGEVNVLLYNGGHQSVYVKHGDFIAQGVLFHAADRLNFKEIETLPTTTRGEKGLGSSG